MERARKHDDSELTVREVAIAALDRASGDVSKATELMRTQVINTPRLYRELMDPLVKNACYDAIRAKCRQQRRVIWSTWQPSQDQERTRIESLAAGTISSLLNFRLQNGVQLRHATRQDVIEAAEKYYKQAENESHKARWLQLIAQHVPAKKKVGDVMFRQRKRWGG